MSGPLGHRQTHVHDPRGLTDSHLPVRLFTRDSLGRRILEKKCNTLSPVEVPFRSPWRRSSTSSSETEYFFDEYRTDGFEETIFVCGGGDSDL